MKETLLLVQLVSTWYLVGLCWLVQRVQYPLMAQVGTQAFAGYEQAHVSRITPVVAPPMLLELASALLVFVWWPELGRRPEYWGAVALLAVVWASTFFVQVPLHNELVRGFDADVHASLVRTNWIRTLAWSARGLLLCGLVLSVSRPAS